MVLSLYFSAYHFDLPPFTGGVNNHPHLLNNNNDSSVNSKKGMMVMLPKVVDNPGVTIATVGM
jgi:hypothetical protein